MKAREKHFFKKLLRNPLFSHNSSLLKVINRFSPYSSEGRGIMINHMTSDSEWGWTRKYLIDRTLKVISCQPIDQTKSDDALKNRFPLASKILKFIEFT